MTQLAVADDLALQRRSAAQLATELADDPAGMLVDMYALAHERRALAVHAAVAVGGERADTPTQEEALELLDVDVRRSHQRYFRQDARWLLHSSLIFRRDSV